MAATNFTPISLYYSTTAATAPVAGNLVSGELAINITDGKLYYKNNAGVVTLLASTSGASGDVVGPASATDNALARFDLTTGKLIQNSVGILSDAGILTGLTGLTSSGPITLSSLTSGRVTFAGASGLLSDSASFTWDGTSIFNTQAAGNNQTPLIVIRNTTSGTAAGSAMYLGNDASFFNGIITKFSSAHTTKPSYFEINNTDNAPVTFMVNNTEKMRLNSTGLGIGTTSPVALLNVSGVAGANAIQSNDTTSTGTFIRIFADTATGSAFNIKTGDFFRWATSASDYSSFSEKMRLDASGNLGLGVTPSAWSGLTAFQVGQAASFFAQSGGNFIGGYVGSNIYYNAGWKYIRNGYATKYDFNESNNGQHKWWIAPDNTSGAGAAATETQAMTLNASGNLGVGVTSPSMRLDVSSGATASTANFTSTTTTAYSPTTSASVTNARLTLFGGNATSAYTAIRFTQSGSFENFFGAVQSSAGTGQFVWGGYNGAAYGEWMRLDSSANLGLGVTPSAADNTLKYVTVGNVGNSFAGFNGSVSSYVLAGTYYNGGWKYAVTGSAASRYDIGSGVHSWLIAPSGTAGANATFTQAMTLDASGALLIGETAQTTVGEKLLVSGFVNANSSVAMGIYAGTSGTKDLNFYSNGNSQFFTAARIRVTGGQTYTDEGFMSFWTTSNNGSNVLTTSEKMRITTIGNVGIGTTSPVSLLTLKQTVAGSLGAELRLINGSTTVGTATQIAFATTTTDSANSAAIQVVRTAGGADIKFSSDGSERMQIDSYGDLLLGTTSSTTWNGGTTKRILAVSNANSGAANSIITLKTNASSVDHGGILEAYAISVTSGSPALGSIGFVRENASNTALSSMTTFFTNTAGTVSEKVRIDSSGNLLVGATDIPTTVRVKGFAAKPSSGGGISIYQASNVSDWGLNTTTGSIINFYSDNGSAIVYAGQITLNGSTTAYTSASDYRLKENIAPMTRALSRVQALNPVTFTFKDSGQTSQGFIAHELQAVIPECVVGKKDAVDADGKPQYQSVDTSFLVATLTAAIQEQQALIESLTTRLTALENK